MPCPYKDNMLTPIHHRRSIRLPGYDYSQPGEYFITICTYQHQPTLGEITHSETALFPSGLIVRKCWLKIPNHFQDVELGAFAVMPNHIHGILHITDFPEPQTDQFTIEKQNCEKFSKPIPRSIPTIVRSFKSASAKYIHQDQNNSRYSKEENSFPVWQRNYYEHIIETEKEYLAIEAYIENNSTNWNKDKLWISKN